MPYTRYSSNNSGGSWWLNDQNWKDLESAGWEVDWYANQNDSFHKGKDRFLGALASVATRRDLPFNEAIEEFERITHEDSTSAGCSCCGQPHNFYYHDDEGNHLEFGPHAVYDDEYSYDEMENENE